MNSIEALDFAIRRLTVLRNRVANAPVPTARHRADSQTRTATYDDALETLAALRGLIAEQVDTTTKRIMREALVPTCALCERPMDEDDDDAATQMPGTPYCGDCWHARDDNGAYLADLERTH